MVLVPAYGRDYNSKRAVEKDFNDGREFLVCDLSSGYTTKGELKERGISSVQVRYSQQRKVTVIKL